jgi:hypothetical protein
MKIFLVFNGDTGDALVRRPQRGLVALAAPGQRAPRNSLTQPAEYKTGLRVGFWSLQDKCLKSCSFDKNFYIDLRHDILVVDERNGGEHGVHDAKPSRCPVTLRSSCS